MAFSYSYNGIHLKGDIFSEDDGIEVIKTIKTQKLIIETLEKLLIQRGILKENEISDIVESIKIMNEISK